MFALFVCHSRAGGNPLWLGRLIPAIVYPRAVPVPAKAWGGGRYDNFSGDRISANIVVLLLFQFRGEIISGVGMNGDFLESWLPPHQLCPKRFINLFVTLACQHQMDLV
jgi:hypothetical protein